MELVAGGRVLVASARKALHGREDLGWVVMLRDRTELQQLTRQLDAVGTMSAALRAQRHEFANQLHTIAGFMSIGQPQQAQDYLAQLAGTGPLTFPVDQAELLQDPYLQAFLGAKGVEADERGVSLRLGPESRGPRPRHRTPGRHHGPGQPDRQRRERRRRRFRGRALGGGGSAGRTGHQRRRRHTPHCGGGFRRRPGRRNDSRGGRGGLRGRLHDLGPARPGRAQGRAWGWRCPASSRAAAAETCGCSKPGSPGGPGAVFVATLPGTPTGANAAGNHRTGDH